MNPYDEDEIWEDDDFEDDDFYWDWWDYEDTDESDGGDEREVGSPPSDSSDIPF